VVPTYNPSYLGGGNVEWMDHSLRAACTKELSETYLKEQAGRGVAHLFHLRGRPR
jgi:hypothetical protein